MDQAAAGKGTCERTAIFMCTERLRREDENIQTYFIYGLLVRDLVCHHINNVNWGLYIELYFPVKHNNIPINSLTYHCA
jgi:hypothetical protein